jgi:hypothetical protein
MNRNQKPQQWLLPATLGLALAATTNLCLATDIVYNFNTDAQGWYAADGHGTVSWDSTHNRGDSGGCLKYTIVAGTDTEVDPRVDVAFDTTGYFCVEFDMMVDPSSGTGSSSTYGNLQTVARTSGWSWDSMWYGSMGAAGGPFSTWKHVKQVFTSAYGGKAHLQLQISSGTASSDIIIYIDNVVIRDGTPPNKAVMNDYAWPDECVPSSSWGAGPPVFSQDTTLHTDGSMKMVVNYGTGATGWIDAVAQINQSWDPGKFTYFDFDLYLDAPTGLPSYGQWETHVINNSWTWNELGTVGLSAANIGTWKHYSLPLPAGTWPAQGYVFHPGGGSLSGTFTYYIDNVTVWKPATPPTITKMQASSGAGGVQITSDDNSSQYQRDAIVTPSGTGPYSWAPIGGFPVTYSFTINDFPNQAAHKGFEAHMYLINGTTDPQPGFDPTYGGADWNVADILEFRVENATNSGVIARINWKTNLPNANPPNDPIHQPVYITGPTAIGTWSLTFTDAVSGVVTGPGITATNFVMPADAVANNFSPALDYVQFGMFKNDNANDGHNNQAHGTFSEVSITTGAGPVITDNFPGPGLTVNNAWRKTSSSAVQWVPAGTAQWLTWTLPDDGFSVVTSGDLHGPWVDAGVTYTYTLGATRVGAVPAANIPAGPAVFFKLKK